RSSVPALTFPALAIRAGFILQVPHGRDELFSTPTDPWRRGDFRGAAGARRSHAVRALWPRPWRPLAVGYAELHAGGCCDRLVDDCDRRILRRLFYREPDAQRRLGTDPAADAAIPDRGRRIAAGRRRSGGRRAERDPDHFGRAGRDRRFVPGRGDGVLRLAFRAAQGLRPPLLSPRAAARLTPPRLGENGSAGARPRRSDAAC